MQHLGVGDVGPRDVSVLKAGAESSFRVPWLISFASQHRTEYTHLGHRVSLNPHKPFLDKAITVATDLFRCSIVMADQQSCKTVKCQNCSLNFSEQLNIAKLNSAYFSCSITF